MELLIVTGLSGAGKTRVINALEDIGFYCVDNIPPALLGGFADLCYSPAAHHGRSAIVMDSRSGKMFRELPHALEELRCRHIPYRILSWRRAPRCCCAATRRPAGDIRCWMNVTAAWRTPSGRSAAC